MIPTLNEIRAGLDPAQLADYPMYDLSSPELPPLGPSFAAFAATLLPPDTPADVMARTQSYLILRALYDRDYAMPVTHNAHTKVAQFVGGHLRDNEDIAPCRARVLVLGKHPGRDETSAHRNFVGPTSQVLWDSLLNVGLKPETFADWYLTNLVKWDPTVPGASKELPRAWVKDCRLVLQQELRLVRPDVIICLGSEASTELLSFAPNGDGKRSTSFGVEAMKGRVVPYAIPVYEPGESPLYHVAQVVTVPHPAAVFRTPDLTEAFEAQLRLAARLIQRQPVHSRELDVDHRVVYSEEHLTSIVDEILASYEKHKLIVAVDAEWQGEQPTDVGAYLRTIQISHLPMHSYCIVVNRQGGGPAFSPDRAVITRELSRLLLDDRVRVGGHFFRADLPWIYHHLNLDLREKYAPAKTPERVWFEGGFDTSLMMHAVCETARFKLEELCSQRLGMRRWDLQLAAWRHAEAKRLHDEEKTMLGYGECPDTTLYPYANYDADGTRRLYGYAARAMQRDQHGNSCNVPYWRAHSASLAVLEMEMCGLSIDAERVTHLRGVFQTGAATLLRELREALNWPDFNPNSVFHCRAALFGDELTGKRTSDGLPTKIRPAGAITLGLRPVMSCGKNAQPWARIESADQTHLYGPSTDKTTLGILAGEHPVAGTLRSYRFISQVVKTFLRPPKAKHDGEVVLDAEGNPVFDKGLMAHVADDGKVHTRIGQHLETGRYSSWAPNLQNLPKRRDEAYELILGSAYSYPIRSVFAASSGHVFVEADYTGAEVAAIMWMAQDPNGVEHARRNNLPETHPDHYDIHSHMAVRCFKLSCPPTKKGLKDAGCKALRVAAKSVVFGVAYARGAKAIARQCREEGADISDADAQRLIEGYFETYPRVHDFLARCRDRVVNERWMANAFGRYRRFPYTWDEQVIAEMQRQAQNFPIQSLVADAVSTALCNLLQYRQQHPEIEFRVALQIHDALLLEVPLANVRDVWTNVLPTCMVERVPVRPTDLSGRPLPDAKEYRFGIGLEACRHWGVPLEADELAKLGIE